jgi:predicted RND superfamily exporter protein
MKHTFFLGWLLVIHVAGWSAWQVSHLQIKHDMSGLYPDDHPLLQHDQRIRKDFRLENEAPFIYILTYPRKESWVEPGKIERLKRLSEILTKTPGVKKVTTLTGAEGASHKWDELSIGSLFELVPPQNWKTAIMEDARLFPTLVSDDFRSTIISVEPVSEDTNTLLLLQKTLDNEIRNIFKDASLSRTGTPLLQSRTSALLEDEFFKNLLIMGATAVFLMLSLFNGGSAAVITIITLVLTNIFALALLSAVNVPLNFLLVTLPVIVSITVMTTIIHAFHLWCSRKGSEFQGDERLRSAYLVMRELVLPNILGSMITSIGFLALMGSPIPMISEYGWVVSMSIVLVSLLAQLLIVLLLPAVSSNLRPLFLSQARWALSSIKKPWSVLLMTSLFFILGIKEIGDLNFSGKLFEEVSVDKNASITDKWIDTSFGGSISYDIVAHAAADGFWKAPENLNKLRDLSLRIRKLRGARTAVSVADIFQGKIPESSGQVSETYFLFQMDSTNPIAPYLSEDMRSARMGIIISDLKSDEVQGLKSEIMSIARKVFPELSFTEGGLANYAHDLNEEVARSIVFSFWQPLAFMGLILFLFFGSLRVAILASLPNLITPALLISCFSWMNIGINPVTALIFPVALGFTFTHTVYFLSRLRRLRRTDTPLETAILSEANPCFLEAIIMFSGFAIFVTSDFSINQRMGLFMMMSVGTAFFAGVFFLPAMLKLFPRALKSREIKFLSPQ